MTSASEEKARVASLARNLGESHPQPFRDSARRRFLPWLIERGAVTLEAVGTATSPTTSCFQSLVEAFVHLFFSSRRRHTRCTKFRSTLSNASSDPSSRSEPAPQT